MSPTKEKGVAGHIASRAKICVVCLKKKDRPLTEALIEGLKKFTTIFESISPEDLRVPTGICGSCKSVLQSKIQASKEGKSNDREFKIPEGFTFSSHIILPRTRSDEATFCNCLLCQISSKKGNPKQINLNELIKNVIQADSSEPMDVNETQMKSNKTLLYCSSCFSLIGKGLSHVCNDTTALENLKALHEKRPILAQAFCCICGQTDPFFPSPDSKIVPTAWAEVASSNWKT